MGSAEITDESDAGQVLVVDDLGDVRTLIALELEAAGFEVHEADDGRAALATCLATDVDVIVLSGPAVLSELRDSRCAHVPIVFLTEGLRGTELVASVGAAAQVKRDQDRRVPQG